MEILIVLVVMVVVMLVAARFDNGTRGNEPPYSPSKEFGFLSDNDTNTDPMYSHQPDNFFYEDHHSPNE
jgi:hypothetical protein